MPAAALAKLTFATVVSGLVVQGDVKADAATRLDAARARAWWLDPPEFRRHGTLPFTTEIRGAKTRAVIELLDAKRPARARGGLSADHREGAYQAHLHHAFGMC